MDDGPGIRTTVFLKGCPLNCLWCHNPEGLSTNRILAVDFIKCVSCGACVSLCKSHTILNNKHVYNSSDCAVCGKCMELCPVGALEFCGSAMSTDEVLTEVMQDKAFYDSSKGGMTLSGGEPLYQFEFALELLKKAKERGLNTCVETSSCVDFNKMAAVAPYVDLFLCDIKETDDENHKKYVGISNKLILDNIKKLDELGNKILLRCPIIPTVNDRLEHFDKLIEIHNSLKNVQGLELMPYHLLGQGKGDRYGFDLSEKAFVPADDETVKQWREYIKSKLKGE